MADRTITSDTETAATLKEMKEAKETNKEATQNAADNISNMTTPTMDKVDKLTTDEYEKNLEEIKASQEKQAEDEIEYETNKSITELQRTEQDAQSTYQKTRNEISTTEQRGMDNQILASKIRGDNGGLGKEQVAQVQNSAAKNRLTVNKEQTKLATDTQRQVADLRAQGEFNKADKLLSITQNYLSQLMSLKQWADEANVGVEEFNIQVEQWEANYAQSLAEAKLNSASTMYNIAYNDYQAFMEQLASSGQALMEAGITPTAEQIQAMAMTQAEALEYLYGYYPHGVPPIT